MSLDFTLSRMVAEITQVSGIRQFREEDIPEVADLWLKVFQHCNAPAAKPLQDYFREIFFENPWCDKELPSLVYESNGGRVAGFLGVVPRTMVFQNRPIRVAVATQLMADDEQEAPYAAARLMRGFLSGPQDLSFSDGANEASENLWMACGGKVALLYSLTWTRILRPTQYMATWVKNRNGLKMAGSLVRPLAKAIDAATMFTPLRRYWVPEVSNTKVEKDPPDEMLLSCVRRFSNRRELHPAYEPDSFSWLLRKARRKRSHGELRQAVVRGNAGNIIGWFLYYIKTNGIAQVLQFGGEQKNIVQVLEPLFHHAWQHGAVAISGELEPGFAKELAMTRCKFTWPGYGVLTHSKHKDILHAIDRGDAFLTRLEGEWWARFSDLEWPSSSEYPKEMSNAPAQFSKAAIVDAG